MPTAGASAEADDAATTGMEKVDERRRRCGPIGGGGGWRLHNAAAWGLSCARGREEDELLQVLLLGAVGMCEGCRMIGNCCECGCGARKLPLFSFREAIGIFLGVHAAVVCGRERPCVVNVDC